MADERIGFIGAGQMATALAHGFLKAKLTTADRLLGADIDPNARERFTKTTAARTTADNAEVVERSDVVFLAVKPQTMAGVAEKLRETIPFTNNKLVVSIAAGIRLDRLSEWFGRDLRLIRVMPNAPCLIGCGASAYCLGGHATPDDGAMVGRLMGALGLAWQIDEKLMDVETGLASSGPAYVYVVIEALRDAGVELGLPRELAAAMAAQAVRGAAEMVLTTGEHPAVLRDRVASPGGTTMAGLRALESGGVRAALMAAVEAATRRSEELGAKI
jgi:pyrroline-5-carboxylate reductase